LIALGTAACKVENNTPVNTNPSAKATDTLTPIPPTPAPIPNPEQVNSPLQAPRPEVVVIPKAPSENLQMVYRNTFVYGSLITFVFVSLILVKRFFFGLL